MVRRRSSKSKAAHSKARPVDRKESKMRRWKTADDVPLDEEDQFHSSRDKILLDGDEVGDDSGDEDEVFALKGMPEDSPSEDEYEEDDGMDEDDDIDDAHYAAAAAAAKDKKKGKGKKGKKGKKDESSEDEEDDESSEEEGWGDKKSAYYASNAEQIESDDEEANELEEQEAKRLQTKARDAMADDDFGLGDVVEGGSDEADGMDEPAPPVVQQLPQDKQSLLRHLEKTNPEALALAGDWEDVAYTIVKSKAKIEKLQKEEPNSLGLSMMHLHYQALLTYATTLAFYLHLRTSDKYVQRPDLLKSHPVLGRLLSLKQALHTLEDLDFAASDSGSELSSDFDINDSELGLDSEEEDAAGEMDWQADAQAIWDGENTLRLGKKGKGKGKGGALLEMGELEGLLSEANGILDMAGKSKRKSKAAGGDEPEPPKKKRKGADKAVTPVFDLVEPELPSSSKSSKSKQKTKQKPQPAAASEDVVDMYGEAAALDTADAADKSARRKSLRFHVARIEGTAARRAGARAGAMGGDDDIPYRERKREREARLAAEVARARAQGADLDDADPELEREDGAAGKKRRRGEEREGGDGSGEEREDGYYDLVRRTAKEGKAKKKAEYEAAAAAARHVDGEEEGAEGPRSLTRAILKNRGLTPSRSKSVRNPRVKKRQKYEQAKKRVASQKQVFRGGADATRYSGEKTGISQTIKSVRL